MASSGVRRLQMAKKGKMAPVPKLKSQGSSKGPSYGGKKKYRTRY